MQYDTAIIFKDINGNYVHSMVVFLIMRNFRKNYHI